MLMTLIQSMEEMMCLLLLLYVSFLYIHYCFSFLKSKLFRWLWFFAYLNWKTDLTSFHSLMLNTSNLYIYWNNNNLISLYHRFIVFLGGTSYKFQYAFMWIWLIMHIYKFAWTVTYSTVRAKYSNNIMAN